MNNTVSCKSCGANDVLEFIDEEARCKYCGVKIYDRPLAKFNPLSRSGLSATGNNTKGYLITGITLMLALSLVAVYLDSPGWFRSDFAITIWSAVIPGITLLWAFNLHPQRRSLVVFLSVAFANALPFLIAVMIKEPRKISSDDLWGISGLFAGCSAAGFMIGAVMNNFRKELKGLLKKAI